MAAKAMEAAEKLAEKEAKAATSKKRTRAKAGSQEEIDIADIIGAINDPLSPAGIKIRDAFRTQFGMEIHKARARKGRNRSVHHDFEILVGPLPGIWRKVEHKGSAACTPVSPTDTPWAAGVQFHNGGCEKYTTARCYARLWYDMKIASGKLASEWGILAPIPTYEDWYKNDAKRQGDPGTLFGKELKKKVREVRGPKSSLLDERATVVEAFAPTEEELRLFKEEAIAELNKVLAEKEYWLTIHGEPTGEFHCRWWPSFSLSTDAGVTVRKELDIWFDFTCDGGVSFSCLLRWGKGAGFSNIRIDAR